MTDVPAELLDGIRELSSLLVSEETLNTALDRVAELSTRTVSGADAVGITLVKNAGDDKRGASVETAAASDERVQPLDDAQYDSNEGPCLQAIADDAIYQIEDLEDEERWPAFKSKAQALGLRSSLSVPLSVGGKAIGALNMYAFSEGAFRSQDLEMAKVFASQAAISIVNVQTYESAVRLSENLTEAMKSRAVIEQAKGMIMFQRRCSPDDAFQTLVAASQTRNRKLRDIAQEVVDAAIQPESGEPAPR